MSFAGAVNTRSRGVGKTRRRYPLPYRYVPDYAEAAVSGATVMDTSGTSARTARRNPTFQGAGTKRAYSKMATRIGRAFPNISNLCDNVVERMQGIKQEAPNSTTEGTFFPGYHVIRKGVSADAGAFGTPLVIFNLTKVSNTASPVYGNYHQLRYNDDGSIDFFERGSQLPTGADGLYAAFYPESVNSNTGTYQCRYIQPRWYDIRLKLYGARKQSVTYDVMLVRFTEEAFLPLMTPSKTEDVNKRKQFWQQFSRNQMVNTIFPQSSDWWKGMKVLRRKRFVLPASSSTDLDVNPESVDFKMYVKDTRVLCYRQDQASLASDTAIDSVAWVSNTSGNALTDEPVNYRQQTFLIIRATDMTSNVTNDDMDDSPSFDFCIRRKLRLIPTIGNL